MAPKPLLLVSDGGDWTANNPRVEFPHIRRIYSFYDAAEHVENAHFAAEGHDYGPSKRAAAYRFLAKHFGLSLSAVEDGAGEIDENFVTLLAEDQLRVFDEQHPRPEYALLGGDHVLGWLNK